MFKRKIIPCLDIKDGKVVKGVKFVDLKDAGKPEICALEYFNQGADELVLLDISATVEGRKTKLDVIKKVASVIDIPLTVGGGISSINDVDLVISAGANKVSINSATLKNPQLITEISNKYGKDSVVVAIDVHRSKAGNYTVLTDGGRVDTGVDAVEWATKVQELGAGSLLVTSMDADGTKEGYDLEITKAIVDATNIPVIASGGCGKLEHFADAFEKAGVSAALAASLFHFGELTIGEVKEYLRRRGIEV